MPRWPALTPAFCLLACAAPKPPPEHAAVRPTPPPLASILAPDSESPETADPRRLPRAATFADLVDAARATDSAGDAHSDKGCLLGGGEASRLEADLLPAARPLPKPASDLSTAIEPTAGSVTVLSAWGNVTGELADVVLLTFTTTTPAAIQAPVVALFMTRKGIFVRGSDTALRAHPEALSSAVATGLLSQLEGPAAIFVTAEAEIPVTAVSELLRAIPNRLESALAVALPKGTRLPPTAAASKELLCPDGLPAPARGAREGELSAQAAQAAVAPLREAALSCALATGGRALLGGRLVLGLRVGADGKAQDLCFVNDAVAEPMLRRCLVSAARDLALPTPSGAGFADLNIPLEIKLDGPAVQRASCD